MDIFTKKKLEEAFDRIYLLLCGDNLATDPLKDKVQDAFCEGGECDKLYQTAQKAREQILGFVPAQNALQAEDVLDTMFGAFSGIERALSKKMFFYGYRAAVDPDWKEEL